MYSNKLKALDDLSVYKKPDTMKSLLNELRLYRVMLDDGQGMEGLAGGLPKVVVGIVDVFIRIGNTFKTNISKFYSKLKRSEIKYFTESNRLKVAKVEDSPYARFVKLDVSLPTGMEAMFMKGVNNVDDIYKISNTYDTVMPFIDSLMGVEDMLVNNDSQVNSMLNGLASQIYAKRNLITPALKDNEKIFSNKRNLKGFKFEKAYETMEEFKLVRLKLTEMEKYLSDTIRIADAIDKADSHLNSLVGYLSEHEDDKIITKKLVDDILNVVTYVANSIDVHGRTSMQQMSLEHNHILNINHMYKHA